MSDMTIEKARYALELHGHHTQKLALGECFNRVCMHAQGFLEGHASRDPEVEKLQREIDQMKKMFPNWTFEKKQLEAELSAEREATRKLVEAAEAVQDGLIDLYNKGHGLQRRVMRDLDDALKFYATPGHSPEGKTL